MSKGVVTRVFDPRRKHKLWRLILLRNGVYVVYLSEKKKSYSVLVRKELQFGGCLFRSCLVFII